MGKAYSEDQRLCVKALLEAGRDEEAIEKETGVSDRTIRRWKVELEHTGRIGKPPESRTGRHRVLSPETEAALFEHKKAHPEMTVDDLLWWLYDQHKVVVGTRTIRRVFERKGDKIKSTTGKAPGRDAMDGTNDEGQHDESLLNSPAMLSGVSYQSPYTPIAQQAEQHLAQVLQQQQHNPQPQPQPSPLPIPATINKDDDGAEDEEALELELQRIALAQREVEVREKLRRLRQSKAVSANTKSNITATPRSGTSSLYNPNAVSTSTPTAKRDSRSKKKIEESKKRTKERQERMLADLERRSRRRDHLTAEWVQSKDIWPLRAQSTLADLMHQYSCYAFNQNNSDTIEIFYAALYSLVDVKQGDWIPHIHDDMLRERMKRKMLQLRNKMQKTGEIVGRGDAYGGWQKADNYTGEAAGQAVGDESEMLDSPMTNPRGGPQQMQEDQLAYDAVPDHHQGMQHSNMPYGAAMMQHQGGAPQYPMMPQQHHPNMLPYGQLDGSHQEGMVM